MCLPFCAVSEVLAPYVIWNSPPLIFTFFELANICGAVRAHGHYFQWQQECLGNVDSTGSRGRDYWPRACSKLFNLDHGGYQHLHLSHNSNLPPCSVTLNGYQRVDVPGSRKMAGIVPPLKRRGARNIGIEELQRSTWYICIVYFLLTEKNCRHGQFQFSFCTPWISRTCLLMLMVCPTVCLYVYIEVFLRLLNYLTKTGKDLERARPAFTLISQSRRLPALLENFLGTFAQNLSNTRLSDPTFTRGYAEELLPR